MTSFNTVNPYNGKPLSSYAYMDKEAAEREVKRAARAFEDWRTLDIKNRAMPLKTCARLLKDRAGEYAALMAKEMGKPVGQGLAEAEKCAWVCDYFADNAAAFLNDHPVETGASKSYIAIEPLGPILAIMPWNFPFWQFFRFAAPALMAGNTVVLKHAPGTTGCGVAIKQLIRDAGFPDGALSLVIVTNTIAAEIIRHPAIRGVTLTGSTRAGRSVAAIAGQALKKTVLELGGSDPYIVLADADVAQAADRCVKSRLINSGQSCIAAKRWIVEQAIADEFESAVLDGMNAAITGDPMDEKTTVGPLARKDLRTKLHAQVTASIRAGAKVLAGGRLPRRSGFFYPPTVLTRVKKGMPAFDEELFGPAAAIVRASNEKHAIQLANDSHYGLGAAIFTADIKRAERIAREDIRAGCVFVNDFVKSDPRLPFGGIKDSGYGRELGHHGILEFVNVKTISIA
jgi:succinate-semialdehyde dehydrogenase/glutarate-semialdehyde dehydrogenase